MSESILAEAERIINGPRNDDYGNARTDYTRTAALFNLITGRDLSPEEGVVFMLCVKLSREAHKHKRDNLVDFCGYAELLNQMEEGSI